MKLEQAIEKAKEGGAPWEPWNVKQSHKQFITPEEVFMSPIFWQCLGKALGWGIKCQNCGGEIGESSGMGKVAFKYQCKGRCGSYFYSREAEVWAKEWHSFVDALSEGKSAEDFFKEL